VSKRKPINHIEIAVPSDFLFARRKSELKNGTLENLIKMDEEQRLAAADWLPCVSIHAASSPEYKRTVKPTERAFSIIGNGTNKLANVVGIAGETPIIGFSWPSIDFGDMVGSLATDSSQLDKDPKLSPQHRRNQAAVILNSLFESGRSQGEKCAFFECHRSSKLGGAAIISSEENIVALGRKWHRECFVCHGSCGKR
jgi:hypothetical protein